MTVIRVGGIAPATAALRRETHVGRSRGLRVATTPAAPPLAPRTPPRTTIWMAVVRLHDTFGMSRNLVRGCDCRCRPAKDGENGLEVGFNGLSEDGRANIVEDFREVADDGVLDEVVLDDVAHALESDLSIKDGLDVDVDGGVVIVVRGEEFRLEIDTSCEGGFVECILQFLPRSSTRRLSENEVLA